MSYHNMTREYEISYTRKLSRVYVCLCDCYIIFPANFKSQVVRNKFEFLAWQVVITSYSFWRGPF